LKISSVRFDMLSIPTGILDYKHPVGNAVRVHKSWDFAVITLGTESGLEGMGYVWTPGYGPKVLRALLNEELKDLLIGENAHATEHLWRKIWKATNYYGRRGLAILGLSMVDMALWDLKARAASLPLHKVLGHCREKVAVYSSGGFLSYTMDELQREVEARLQSGYRAIKIFVGHSDVRKDIERVRKLAGDRIQVMVDANQAWRHVGDALRHIQYLEEFDLSWIEEPLPADDYEGYQKLQEKIRIPLAGGENAYTPYEALQYIQGKKVDIFQPDIFRIGGITGLRNASLLAEVNHIPVAPHLAPEISLPVMASVSNAFWMEYMPLFEPMEIFAGNHKLEDGFMHVSELPGHGVQFHPQVLKDFSVSSVSI
jgi:L-alanine-DL-glutamate epimerase-like enolase superfamily enzyme